jgi:single-strand DNA-binding protein
MATRAASKTEDKTETETDRIVYGDRIDGSIAGNLTVEPELRFTASGRAVCNFSVAINDRVKNEETQQWEDAPPVFFRVNVWGTQAENCAEHLLRGDRIAAVGYFQDRTYTDREGERKTVTEFTAKDIGPSMLFHGVSIKRVKRSAR